MYREYHPGPALAPFAECLWSVETRDHALAHLVLPDGCLDILFWAEGGLRAVGTMTRRQVVPLPPGARVAGIRFRPGVAGRFLGIAPRELTDGWAPLEDLWGRRGRGLHERLQEAASPREYLRLLAGSLPVPDAAENAFFRALQMLTTADGNLSLDEVTRAANLSPRQFRRRCLEETGLTPKHLSRVLRFQRALRLLRRAPERGWAHLAAECGYYDQAHLIRDFREFAASTPTGLASGDGRFLQSAPGADRIALEA
ncbi:MAG: helix-turn-helix domain-containing protein [Bryobacteraceae bacterium]